MVINLAAAPNPFLVISIVETSQVFGIGHQVESSAGSCSIGGYIIPFFLYKRHPCF